MKPLLTNYLPFKFFRVRKLPRSLTHNGGNNGVSVRTNALLAKNGVTTDKLATMTMEEVAQMLGVDGVISGTFESSQPMSGGAAVAMLMVGGFSGPTNTGKLAISINDGKSGELLWKYDKSLSRGFGSDTNSIITTIMRKASRQFPYSKEFKG